VNTQKGKVVLDERSIKAIRLPFTSSHTVDSSTKVYITPFSFHSLLEQTVIFKNFLLDWNLFTYMVNIMDVKSWYNCPHQLKDGQNIPRYMVAACISNGLGYFVSSGTISHFNVGGAYCEDNLSKFATDPRLRMSVEAAPRLFDVQRFILKRTIFQV